MLLTEFLHRRRRRESPVDPVPDRPDPAGRSPDDRLDLSAALRAVPPRQRAVVVLRYWEGLAKRDKQAVRDATRILPDGRTVTAGLAYNAPAPSKTSFDRHVLSLQQLAALVTDPGALQHFPHR